MWAGCVGGTGPGLCRKALNSRNCGNKGTLSRFWTPFPCGPSPTPLPRPSINVSIFVHSIAWNYTIHICNSQWLHNTCFQIIINYLDHIFTCLLILPLFQISTVFFISCLRTGLCSRRLYSRQPSTLLWDRNPKVKLDCLL